MGSKSRIAKQIVPIIQKYIDDNQIKTYIEPFCGGCNVIDKVKCEKRIASDINPYLISLLQAIVYEDKKLPDDVPKDHYSDVRSNKDNNKFEKWYVGAIGFLASYNGRFFDGGYAGIVHTKTNKIRNYYDEAKRNLEEQISNLFGIDFEHRDYKDYCSEYWDIENCLIYCDPPYQDVKKYANSQKFNHDDFWSIMRHWSKNNIVLISEQNAPDDFKCIWEQPIIRSIDNNKRVQSTEKLFKLKT